MLIIYWPYVNAEEDADSRSTRAFRISTSVPRANRVKTFVQFIGAPSINSLHVKKYAYFFLFWNSVNNRYNFLAQYISTWSEITYRTKNLNALNNGSLHFALLTILTIWKWHGIWIVLNVLMNFLIYSTGQKYYIVSNRKCQ